MIIAVEGATCTGKSTLIELLKERVPDAEYVHKDRPQTLTRRWVLEDYVLKYEKYEPAKDNLLFDRLHWGEATYSHLYRPDTNKDGFGLLGVAGWRWVELFLLSRGAVVARLTTSDQDLTARLASRGDDHVLNVPDLLEISKLYDRAALFAPSNHASYNTSGPNDNTAGFANMLITGAKALEAHAENLSWWPGYIGSPRPDVLLVGDQRNVTKEFGDETRLPFMPVNGNSGDYLLKALPEELWARVGIVNALEHGRPLGELWKLLHKPPVIALGHSAKRWLDFWNVPIAANYPHPQFVRRFRAKDGDAYGRAILHTATTGDEDSTWRR